MNILNQRDPKWGNIKLGSSNTYIKDYGCTITCIAMILGTTPDVVNEKLKSVGGFDKGNLVIWDKITQAFPGTKIKRVWSYDNTDVKANIPNVLVEVPGTPIGGTGKHWVVYVGNQKLYDPWTGKERPTSDFANPSGYCVIYPKLVTTPPPQPTPGMVTIPQKELDEIRLARDTNFREAEKYRKLVESLETRLKEKEAELSRVSGESAKQLKIIEELQAQAQKEKEAAENKVLDNIPLKTLLGHLMTRILQLDKTYESKQ